MDDARPLWGRAIPFTESIDLTGNLIWKYLQRHTHNGVYSGHPAGQSGLLVTLTITLASEANIQYTQRHRHRCRCRQTHKETRTHVRARARTRTHLGIETPSALNQHRGQHHRPFPGLSRATVCPRQREQPPWRRPDSCWGRGGVSHQQSTESGGWGRLSGRAGERVRLRRQYLSPAIPRITCGILTPRGCLRVPTCLLGPWPLESSLPSPEKQEPRPSPLVPPCSQPPPLRHWSCQVSCLSPNHILPFSKAKTRPLIVTPSLEA